MVALAGPTHRGIEALSRLVGLHARRRPEEAVPAVTLRMATQLLNDARKVLSREIGPGLYTLSPAPVWSELAAALQLAEAALAEFTARHQPPSPAMRVLRRRIAARIEQLNQG
jgi:hypothetical protein